LTSSAPLQNVAHLLSAPLLVAGHLILQVGAAAAARAQGGRAARRRVPAVLAAPRLPRRRRGRQQRRRWRRDGAGSRGVDAPSGGGGGAVGRAAQEITPEGGLKAGFVDELRVCACAGVFMCVCVCVCVELCVCVRACASVRTEAHVRRVGGQAGLLSCAGVCRRHPTQQLLGFSAPCSCPTPNFCIALPSQRPPSPSKPQRANNTSNPFKGKPHMPSLKAHATAASSSPTPPLRLSGA
jgi:hypothetical protein